MRFRPTKVREVVNEPDGGARNSFHSQTGNGVSRFVGLETVLSPLCYLNCYRS